MNKPLAAPQNFAFYGSLRPDLYNYRALVKDTEGLQHHGTAEVPGYTMHSLGSYPMCIPNEKGGNIIVDLFTIKDQRAIDRIDRMELGAGYQRKVLLINDVEYIMYEGSAGNARWLGTVVESGDWVEYQQPKHLSV